MSENRYPHVPFLASNFVAKCTILDRKYFRAKEGKGLCCQLRSTLVAHLRVSESADLANRPFGAKRQAGAWLTKVPRKQ